MADDFTHTGLEVVGRHVPDSSVETDASGQKHVVELPGMYEIGAMVEGVFVPLLRRKAGSLLADIARLKQSKSKASEPVVPGSPVEPPPPEVTQQLSDEGQAAQTAAPAKPKKSKK